jgi:hypothetical protein
MTQQEPRDIVKRIWLFLPVLLVACIGGGSTGPGENVNLTGNWAGPVRVALGVDTLNAPLAMQIQQSSNTGELTGTLSFTPIGEDRPITGEVKDREVTLFTQAEESPEGDCHLYTQRWVFTVRTAELRLTAVSGQLCEPDGLGGHATLRTITGGSGTVLLQ